MKKCAIISGKELNAGDKMKQNTQGKRKQEEAKFLHSHYDLWRHFLMSAWIMENLFDFN